MMDGKKIKALSRGLIMLGSSVMLSSCSLMESNYQRESMPFVSTFDAQNIAYGKLSEKYWETFDDPLLNEVIARALKNNFDLKKAVINVEKARIVADLSENDRYPTLDASLGVDAKRALSYHDSIHRTSSSSFSISYQADLFGRIEAENRASLAEYEATLSDEQAMYLTVIENTAKAYWKYAYCQKEVLIMRQSAEDSKQRLALVASKYKAGTIDASQYDTARINDLKIQDQLEKAYADLKQNRNALNIMLGEASTVEHDAYLPDSAKLKSFPLDVPSALLERRPDLMAAEARVRKSLAVSDEAFSSFFPQVIFSAGISAGSTTTFANFLANPLGALGAAISLPFVNFHRLSLERQSSLKDQEIAQLDFVSTYINAVNEVYDAITLVSYNEKKMHNAQEQYALALSNYDRIFNRYRAGSSSLSELLDAADDKRNAQISSAQSLRDLLSGEITLMSALGGGFEQSSVK